MTTNAKYNLHDDNLNGWGFELDFTEWDTDTIVQWIELLDDDFGDDYYEKFNIQSITGEHFKRNKLGNAQWCRKELGMNPQTANCFSLIVRQRITKYEHIQNSSNIQPQISINDIDVLPMSSLSDIEQIPTTKGHLKAGLIDAEMDDKADKPVNKNQKHIRVDSRTFHTSKAKDFTSDLFDNDLIDQNEEESAEELEPGFDFFATRSDGDILRASSFNTIHDIGRSQSYHPSSINQSDIDAIYLTAVSLYENKHYEECKKVINSVLNIDKKHIQAEALLKELSVQQNKQHEKPRKRGRYHTVSFTIKTKNKKDSNKKQKRKFTFGRKKPSRKDESKKKQKHMFSFGRKKKKSKPEKEEQKQELTDRCQIEFQRFLTKRVGLSNHYQDLEERFSIAGYNDIRLLKDFDHDTLDEIGLKELHIKCFLRKIDIFMNEIKCFQDWLKRIIIKHNILNSDGMVDLFENNGIMTFQQLHTYIKSENDLEEMIKNRGNDCKILWNEIRNMHSKQIQNMSLAEQQKMIYDEVNTVMMDTFGFTSQHSFNATSSGNKNVYITPQ